LEKYNALDWGICGVGLREADRTIYNILKKQDYLYTLIVQHPKGNVECEVIGSLNNFLLAVDTPNLVIEKMAHPDTKIVSLTITEGGYNFNSTTGLFNFENPDVQHELQYPNEPKTVYGFITAALRKRQANGLPPFTVLSCDNIQHNGDMARKMFLAFAKKQDPELAKWMEEKVCFPNSMVDRITPVTTTADIEYLQKKHNLNDEWPVVCEPFIQWVVEDNFSNGRPSLEKLGVQFVSDVTPYEKMKIRLLNAGHSVLGIPGALHGHATINACMEDEVFATFMRQFMDKEVTPILDAVEGIDLEKYKDSLEERFSNPNIKDSVSRICAESSAKLPKFLVPTLQENLAKGGSFEFATLILAAWCYYSDKGINENMEPLEIIDVMKNELHQAAKETQKDVLGFLKQSEFFGDLIENEPFTKKYVEMVQLIYGGESIKKLMHEMI
jgi:mannitol 2-dehydrogenase